MSFLKNFFGKKDEINLQNFNEKLNLGEHFYLMTYQEHYEEFLQGIKNKNKVIAELFVFRAWTTQLGFRIFSSKPTISEEIIESIIAQGEQLGIGILNKLEHVNVESEINMPYIDLIDSRWQDYDNVFIANKNNDLPIPTRQICSKVTDFCKIKDPTKLYWLSIDFLSHLNKIKEQATKTKLLN